MTKATAFVYTVNNLVMSSVKIALAQIHVEGGDLDGNLRRAESVIATAAAAKARIVVLPETMDLGWMDSKSRAGGQAIPQGGSCRRLCAAAARNGVYVCSGLTEKAEGGLLYNAAVLIDPAGNVLVKHRKINELEIAHQLYAKGDRLAVAHTELGTLGVMICADGFARDHLVSRTLAYMGARIILSPCAWAVPADHDNEQTPYGALWLETYGPVAREFGLWIVAVSNVGLIKSGPWAGRPCIGSSMVIGPDGNLFFKAPFGVDAEALLYVDIPLSTSTDQAGCWNGLFDHPSLAPRGGDF